MEGSPPPPRWKHFLTDPLGITRILFVLISTFLGGMVGLNFTRSYVIEGSAVGFLLGLFAVGCEIVSSRIPPRRLITSVLGLAGGLVVGNLAAPAIPPQILGGGPDAPALARLIACLLGAYFGILLTLKNASRLALLQSGPGRALFTGSTGQEPIRILDTSVVLDPRLQGLVQSGILQGALIVPEFVLLELQKMADSADPKKRSRGLRGLALLSDLRKVTQRLAVMEHDYPELLETDHKLVTLAREIHAEILTNDSALQRVAAVQNLPVLNLNELADLLRSSVTVGDELEVLLEREGKEAGQALGNTPDGAMIIVDQARPYLNTTVTVVVTRVLHSGTGRVLFARLKAPEPLSSSSPSSFSPPTSSQEEHQ
jgi:uncharacterized protein YacL